MALTEQEMQSILDHMNQDHEDTLRNYVAYFGGIHDVRHAQLRAITRHEMRIHAEGDSVSCTIALPLSRAIDSPDEARQVLVEMARVARQGLMQEGIGEL